MFGVVRKDSYAFLNFIILQPPSSLFTQTHPYCQKGMYSTGILERLVNWEKQGIPKAAGLEGSNAFDTARMTRLLNRLGNPHLKWPAIHIAGSKGKGSTATMITEMMRNSGLKVGLYTSPHMQHIGERLSLKYSSHLNLDNFEHLVQTHQQQLEESYKQEQGKLSHFEAVTALAFRHFADENVDMAVIETGMGGLTDATNVIGSDNLQLSVITALGMEHAAALGGTIQSIALAKSGIMKQGRPVVISHQKYPEALEVVLHQAALLGCEVFQAQDLVEVQHLNFTLAPEARPSAVLETVDISRRAAATNASLTLPTCLRAEASLVGPHQHNNIATAVTAAAKLRKLGWALSDQDLVAGIGRAYMPGRFQVLGLRQKDNSPTDSGRFVVLDGAHTQESAAALKATLSTVFPGVPIIMVLAMAEDKDHRAVVDELRGCSPKAVIFTTAMIAGSSLRSCSPGVLAAQWQTSAMMIPGARCRQLIQASLPAAVEKAMHELSAVSGPGIICVAGSLHAAAQAQQFLNSEQAKHKLA